MPTLNLSLVSAAILVFLATFFSAANSRAALLPPQNSAETALNLEASGSTRFELTLRPLQPEDAASLSLAPIDENTLGGGFDEIGAVTPVAEAATWVMGTLALLLLCFTQRRRLGAVAHKAIGHIRGFSAGPVAAGPVGS